jgi:hypothetical protein
MNPNTEKARKESDRLRKAPKSTTEAARARYNVQ